MADDFLTALTEASAGRIGGKCSVSLLLASMPPAHRDAVLAEFDAINDARDRGVAYKHNASSLARILTQHGYRVAPKTLNRHIRGGCTCG